MRPYVIGTSQFCQLKFVFPGQKSFVIYCAVLHMPFLVCPCGHHSIFILFQSVLNVPSILSEPEVQRALVDRNWPFGVMYAVSVCGDSDQKESYFREDETKTVGNEGRNEERKFVTAYLYSNIYIVNGGFKWVNITNIHKDFFHCHQYSKTNTTFRRLPPSENWCLCWIVGGSVKSPCDCWWYYSVNV